MSKYLKIIYCVAICLAMGYLSSNVTQSSISTWYPEIKNQFQSAKLGFLLRFGPCFFIMMGIAAGMVLE